MPPVKVSDEAERKDTRERHAWRSRTTCNHYHKHIKSDPRYVKPRRGRDRDFHAGAAGLHRCGIRVAASGRGDRRKLRAPICERPKGSACLSVPSERGRIEIPRGSS